MPLNIEPDLARRDDFDSTSEDSDLVDRELFPLLTHIGDVRGVGRRIATEVS